MRTIYNRRKADLVAVGVLPTLKRIVFFRTALGRAVSMQPLIAEQGGGSSFNRLPDSEPRSQSSRAAVAGAVDFEAIKAALAQQLQKSQQFSADLGEMRESNGRLHAEVSQSNGHFSRLHAEFSQFKQQQHQAVASLTAQMQLLCSNDALQRNAGL